MKADQDLLGRVELVEERTNIALGRTGSAGPGGAGPMTTFVFRPGGVASSNVFTSWPALIAACFQTQGPKTVWLDNTFGAVTIPAGAWTMSSEQDVTLVANGLGVTVTVADGAQFLSSIAGLTCLTRIQGMQINYSGVGAVPVSIASAATPTITLEQCVLACAGTTTPFIQSTGAGTAVVFLGTNTQFFSGLCANAANTSTLFLEAMSPTRVASNTLGSAAGAGILVTITGATSSFSFTQTASLGAITPIFNSNLSYMVANRVFGSVAALTQAAGTGGILTANGQITKSATGKYRLNYTIVASNAALGDMTLTFQAANAAAGLAASSIFTHTITVPANGNKVSFSGSLIFDGSAGSPNGGALLPASAAGVTFFNFAITAGAGNFTTASQVGVVSLEECG